MALNGLQSLEYIIIGENVENIVISYGSAYGSSFYGTRNLLAFIVDENNPYYKAIDGNLYSKDGQQFIRFATANTITSLVIPDGVTKIVEGAFEGCTNIVSVEMPDTVTTIGAWSFYCCTKLSTLKISKNIDDIGYYALNGCDSTLYAYYEYGQYVQSIDNPYAILIDITDKYLSSYTVNKNTQVIYIGAFQNCSHATTITVPEENTRYKSIDGNLYSKDGKTLLYYARGKSDTSFVISENVTCIAQGAFSYSKNLMSITIGNNVSIIGDSAFSWCTGLTSITIGNSVTTIGERAFASCQSVSNIIIGNSVTYIGTFAFSNCSSLKSITIGSGINSIESYAFYDCPNLSTVFYEGSSNDWNKIDIDKAQNDALINATRYYNA